MHVLDQDGLLGRRFSVFVLLSEVKEVVRDFLVFRYFWIRQLVKKRFHFDFVDRDFFELATLMARHSIFVNSMTRALFVQIRLISAADIAQEKAKALASIVLSFGGRQIF